MVLREDEIFRRIRGEHSPPTHFLDIFRLISPLFAVLVDLFVDPSNVLWWFRCVSGCVGIQTVWIDIMWPPRAIITLPLDMMWTSQVASRLHLERFSWNPVADNGGRRGSHNVRDSG